MKIFTRGNIFEYSHFFLLCIYFLLYFQNYALEVIRDYPNSNLESLMKILNSTPGSRRYDTPNNPNNQQRATQTQRIFGVTQYAIPRAPNVNIATNGGQQHPNQPMQQQTSSQIPIRQPKWPHNSSQTSSTSSVGSYESSSSRSSNNFDSLYQLGPPYGSEKRPLSGNFMSDSETSDLGSWKSNSTLDSTSGNGTRFVDYKQTNRDAVTLRKKSDNRHLANNQQHRWSAEVLHKNAKDDSNKRNSMEIYSHKPPPPYPGMPKNSLTRISSQEGEFQTTKNTPITVIFDQEKVSVVGGIPEVYNSTNPSSPSSSTSSLPVSLKAPPPYEYIAQKGQQPAFMPPQTVMVKGKIPPTSTLMKHPSTSSLHQHHQQQQQQQQQQQPWFTTSLPRLLSNA